MVRVEPPETIWPLVDELEGRAAERERIDAVMRVEALIFIGEQQLQKPRIDVFDRRRQPPAPFRRGVGAQQLAVAVEHHVRGVELAPERRRAERLHIDRRGERHGGERAAGTSRQISRQRFILPP